MIDQYVAMYINSDKILNNYSLFKSLYGHLKLSISDFTKQTVELKCKELMPQYRLMFPTHQQTVPSISCHLIPIIPLYYSGHTTYFWIKVYI